MATSTAYLYTWKIENYSFCSHQNGDEFRSPFFQAEIFGQSDWFISFYPRGCNQKYERYMSIFLEKLQNVDENIIFDLKIEILNAQNVVLVSGELLNCNFQIERYWGFHDFIEIDQIIKKLENCEDILTIRCHILSKKSTKLITECEAHSKIGVNRISFEWECKLDKKYDFTEKKEILLSNDVWFEITLTIHGGTNLTVEIKKLRNLSKKVLSQILTFRIVFWNKLEGERLLIQDRYVFSINEMRNLRFIPKDNENYDFLKGKRFILNCDISASNGIITSYISKVNTSLELKMFNALQDDLRALYIAKKFPDVMLKVDNETFSAHRSILAFRSPVFSTMFDQDMVESQTGVVEILDVDAKTMNLFLEFIYTATVNEMDYESALKLLVVSDKYEVLSLKERCCSFLMSMLSIDNVCEVFNIADMVNHTLLKETALAYIQANASLVLPSTKWTDFIETNTSLATDILSTLSVSLGSTGNRALTK